MKLYVCWGTFRTNKGHPCGEDHEALLDSAYDPRVGFYRPHPFLAGRGVVQGLRATYRGPTLVLENGTIIDGSENIIEWVRVSEAAGPSE